MAVFGESYSKFQSVQLSIGTVVDLQFSIIKPRWAETNIVQNQSVINGIKAFTKIEEDFATFDVICNLWKNADPQATFETIFAYNHDIVNFMPHEDSELYILGTDPDNLITNGSFTTDSDWIKGAGWTISGGTANLSPPSTAALSQNNIGVIGQSYFVSFEVIENTLTGSGTVLDLNRTEENPTFTKEELTVGTHTLVLTPNHTGFLRFRARSGATGGVLRLDNVSVEPFAEFYIVKMVPFYVNNEPPMLQDKLLITFESLVAVDPASIISA